MVAGSTHATIQAALDAACAAGDTVWVLPGTYPENLLFPARDLELRATAGPADTIVDGSACTRGPASCSVLVLDAGQTVATVVHGLTLRGGRGSYDPARAGCDVPTSSCGGGVLLWSSAATIEDNVVEGNVAAGSGGGVFVSRPPGAVVLDGNTVANNEADVGGGASIDARDPASVVDVTGNTFRGNAAAEWGGGLLIRYHYDWALLTGNTFEDNTAGTFGGGLTCLYGKFTGHAAAFAGNTFTDNAAGIDGGGVYSECTGWGLVDDNTLSGNTPTGCSGVSGETAYCD